MYTCAPHEYLVPTEARKGTWELQMVVAHPEGPGNWTQDPLQDQNVALTAESSL